MQVDGRFVESKYKVWGPTYDPFITGGGPSCMTPFVFAGPNIHVNNFKAAIRS